MSTTKTHNDVEQLAIAASGAAGLLGISRAQWFKLHASGKVPMPIRLGTRAPRWLVAELRAWLDAGVPDRQTWERMKRSHGQRQGGAA